MRSGILALVFFSSITVACGQSATDSDKKSAIHWMGFEDAVQQSQTAPKKIFIDLYTSWCGWCKKMDASTFSDPEVAAFINQHYYPVKLDAERKDTIFFFDKVFAFKPEYKCNEIAIALLSGNMGYPSYVFLNEKFALMGPAVQGYRQKEDMMVYLNYFSNNENLKQDFESFKSGQTKTTDKIPSPEEEHK